MRWWWREHMIQNPTGIKLHITIPPIDFDYIENLLVKNGIKKRWGRNKWILLHKSPLSLFKYDLFRCMYWRFLLSWLWFPLKEDHMDASVQHTVTRACQPCCVLDCPISNREFPGNHCVSLSSAVDASAKSELTLPPTSFAYVGLAYYNLASIITWLRGITECMLPLIVTVNEKEIIGVSNSRKISDKQLAIFFFLFFFIGLPGEAGEAGSIIWGFACRCLVLLVDSSVSWNFFFLFFGARQCFWWNLIVPTGTEYCSLMSVNRHSSQKKNTYSISAALNVAAIHE